MKFHLLLLILVLALAQTGCGGPPAGGEIPPEDPATQSEVLPTESENLPTESPLQLGHTKEATEMSAPPPVEKIVQLAQQDLANRLEIGIGGINLVKSEEMLWPNEALGCPRPGVFYPSGRVAGFQIWLEVDGTEYIYNTDYNGTLILCPELNPHVPNTDTGPTPGVPIR